MSEVASAPSSPPSHGGAKDASEDAAIVAGMRAGDARAFEQLVRRDVVPMRAVAMRLLQNEADADEVVQEAFLNAYKNFGSFRGDARLSTWLHRIVVNAALGRLRKRSLRTAEGEVVDVESLLPRFADDGYPLQMQQRWAQGADDLVSQAETRERVRALIQRLPENYRTVLVLRDIEELDTAESAELLGLTPGTLKVRLHRARQALRNLLERELELTGDTP